MGERTCSVDGCERKFYGRAMCQLHYKRWWKTGSTEPRVHVPKTCKVEGCERKANVPGSARGWCGLHYGRWQAHGDPLHTRPLIVGVAGCAIDGCIEVVSARGWCVKHWTRWRRFGDPEARLRGEVYDGRRICPGCMADKPLEDYSPGSTGRCRRCNAVAARERRKDPEVQQAIHEYYKRYTKQNPGIAAERAKNWRDRNPDQVRASTAKRRARKVAAFVEDFTPREIFERDAWTCGICKGAIPPAARYPDPMSASLDHVVPLARGGSHRRANCQATHLRCNIRKGARVA